VKPVAPSDRDMRMQQQVGWARQQGAASLQAGDFAAARRWLDRAHRLSPTHDPLAVERATLLLRLDPAEALAAFESLAQRHQAGALLIGAATAALLSGATEAALGRLQNLLSCHAFEIGWDQLATCIVMAAGCPGWCGLASEGRLVLPAGLRGVVARLDGRMLDARKLAEFPALPPGWERATELSVTLDGAPLPGSPIQIRQIRRLDGYYAFHEGGLLGWAWHPADPRRDPELQLPTRRGARPVRFLLNERRPALLPHVPLAEPRAILLSPAMLADAIRPWRLLGPDGAPLPGSSPAAPPAAPARPPPAHLPGMARLALICLLSADHQALPAVPDEIDRLILVLPGVKLAGPVPPGAVVIRQRHDLGWGAAMRAGLAAAPDHDVLVLPPGARLEAGMLGQLRQAAWSAADVASASPLALASDGSAPAGLDLPVTVAEACWSPCLYLRHDAIAAVTVRATLFGQGGGEDRDMTRRLTQAGWRHLMLPWLAMAPVEPTLSPGRQVVRARNIGWLKGAASPDAGRSTPYPAIRLALHNPTTSALHAWAEQAWRGGRRPGGAVVLVTHGRGGGVARLVAHRAAALTQQGLRAILLHPTRLPNGQTGCVVSAHGEPADRGLLYAMPQEFPALARLLASDAPRHLEWHHRLDHHPILALLADRLGVPTDIWQHDYACFCPRISLLGVSRQYCGEPTEPAACIACVAARGSLLSEPIDIVSLHERSRVEFARARDVFVASRDVATRLRRHFPGLAPRIASWDAVVPAPPPFANPRASRLRICVIGALAGEKGQDVLLACARDAASRDLALEFILLGHSEEDAALLATGRVWISGKFEEAELASLIVAQQADFAFLPSIIPETWCYALSSAWQAGLAVAVFGIGTQSERIRDAGAGSGWVLPLGLSAEAINAIFLRIAPQSASALSPSATCSAIATLQPGTPTLTAFLDPRPRFLSHEGEQPDAG
jgi:glycosyltransferase involved in cell wall biosynthesis